MPDGPLIKSVSPRSRLKSRALHEVLTVGSAYFDSVDLKTALLRDAGLDVAGSALAREFSSSSPSRRMMAAR